MEQGKNPDRPVILVVDDEALLRLSAADVLQEGGYEVVEAADAEEALAILASRGDVRMLFTDVQLPGSTDGMRLARQVHQRWPDIVLLITSGRLRPREEEIPDDGEFVPKPYEPRRLLARVRQLLASHPPPA
jgi:CheY-like chemotaxis protein